MASLPHASGKDKAKELRQRIDDSLDTLANPTFARFEKIA